MKQKAKQIVYRFRITGWRVRTILFLIFLFLALWVSLSAKWAFTTWSNLQMSEIIYELTAPLTGTGNNMIEEYIMVAPVPALVVVLITGILLTLFRKKALTKKIVIWGMILSLLVTFGTGAYTFYRLDVGTYLVNRGEDSTYIEENYADPSEVNLTFPETKRNLIYIYLESMETTYADEASGGGMQENYIPRLTTLAQENEDFSGATEELNGAYALTGSTWTMGALFAQTSGLPLQIPLDTNGMSSQEVFFPGITTLGDILEEEGYHQTFLLGSNATFGGRRLYFTEHGNYEMQDYSYAKEQGLIDPDYKVWWGYEDAKLFAFAKNTLTDLASGEEPFNLTMLTVDTHFPDGYVCSACEDVFGENQYANVMHCSDHMVDEFLSWCQEQSWYENTTIVIAGDHETMDADFCEGVDSSYERKVYTCYINSAVEMTGSDTYRTYTTFDHFPTTLAAMGVDIEGDRLGLGTNLFSEVETLAERDGLDTVNVEMMRNSEFMLEASQISEEVVALREEMQNTKVSVDVEVVEGNYLQFRVYGLEGIKDHFKYAFIHCRNSNQLTLTEPILQEMSDGSFAIKVPQSKYQGYLDITYMLRLRTEDGTIDMTDAIPYTIEWLEE